MAVSLDAQTLGAVFQSRPDILAGIQRAADSPARVTLFNNIASFVHSRLQSASATPLDEPALKRRRVDIGTEPANGSHTFKNNSVAATATATVASVDGAAAEPVLLEVKDISVSIPQRKKYDLCFTQNYLYARAAGTAVPVQGIVYTWRDFEYAFFLPVPEKTQVQHNYVLFPRNTCLPSTDKTAATASGPPAEPLVFTVPAGAPKPGTVLGPSAATAAAVSDTYPSLLHWALTTHLRRGGNTSAQIVAADPKVFHSAVRQSTRPGEKAVHVKAFRGSKDGYLFFLPTGILWAFKKPLLFIPLDRVIAVSYTSVLQRTFNMVVEVDVTGTPAGASAGGDSGGDAGPRTEEFEFAMLDQEDYQGIDQTYVRRHGLQDRSMAERRKAKRELAENARDGKKKGDANDDVDELGDNGEYTAAGAGGADDGMTELEKAHLEAEQLLQDEEDEEEEDYDPGSEGDSEGEGETSDEEDEDDGEDGEGEEDEDDEMEYDKDGGAEEDERDGTLDVMG